MRDDSPQWQDVGEPATAAEAEALRAIKAMLPDGGIAWAWSNLSFVSVEGRVAETDLLLLTRSGLTLVELKGWHGRITGNQRTWTVGGTAKDNPLFLTDQKAKRLRSLLGHVQRQGRRQVEIPFISAITVLHGRGCDVALDEVASTATYALDGFDVRGVPLLSEYLDRQPRDSRDAIDLVRGRQVASVIAEAGFTAPPRVRRVGDYVIDREAQASQGPSWVDVIAEDPHLPGERKRIRVYDVPRGASAEARTRVERTAKREYLLTTGLKHVGVVAPQLFVPTESGPALIFEHDPKAVRLDTWLAGRFDSLPYERRLAILRSVAEVLQYTHSRGVTHRALSPAQVYITEDRDRMPLVTVRDWQTGREDPGIDRGTSTPRPTLLRGTRNVADIADVDFAVYLAPEAFVADEPDGVALDVYGLGALAYLLLTGSAPAPNVAALEERLHAGRGLDPATDLDGVPDALRALVQQATRAEVIDRTQNVAAFLEQLTEAERSMAGDAPEPVLDPLEAQAGDVIDDRFIVEERLGSGSTGVALLVDDTTGPTVIKIAHNVEHEARLQAEYRALSALDHPRVVRPLAEPFLLAGRLVLQMEDAGRPTLGARIRDEGRLTLDQLSSYGADLLEAAAHLEERGILHRDIKPENLGVRPAPGDRRPRLVLFDFSLSAEPLDNVRAGTPPYLDPFLGTGRRPRYDRAAERFAIAATLFEMATGSRPSWGSGSADPAAITDEVALAPGMFEPSVAPGMVAFFRKALAREASQRFGDLSELAQAWVAIFATADALTQGDEAGDAPVTGPVDASTPLEDSGLSARALSAIHRLPDVHTVGDLLAVPPFAINNMPGIGVTTRREIQRRMREWRAVVGDALGVSDAAPPLDPARRGIDALVESLVPRSTGRNATEVAIARLILGLAGDDDLTAWPDLTSVASRADVTRARVSQILDKLRGGWRTATEATGLADEVAGALEALGGVAEAAEIARALLATQGSAALEPERSRQAIGAVRAVVEADQLRGGDSRFAFRRIGRSVVIVAEAEDPDAPPGDATLDWVRQLGAAADHLVARDQVPVRAAALQALKAVPGSPARTALPDDRLLRIGAAASKAAAVGGRGEFYPRGLATEDALRLTLAGVSASRMRLTPEVLADKVSVRFPEAAPLPGRPALDRLLLTIDASLVWNGSTYGSATTTSTVLPSYPDTTVLGNLQAGVPFNEVDARLRASLASAGYLTLAVDPRRVDQASRALAAVYGVRPVNLTDILLDAAQDLARESSVDWDFLLAVDALDPQHADRQTLDGFVGTALSTVLPGLLAAPEPLLLLDAAPLGRYRQQHWLADLANLATPRPAARWLLVPHRSSVGAPQLDGGVAVPLGADGFLTLAAEDVEELDRSLARGTTP